MYLTMLPSLPSLLVGILTKRAHFSGYFSSAIYFHQTDCVVALLKNAQFGMELFAALLSILSQEAFLIAD